MWLNFLGLLPVTVLVLLLIAVAFLRFYDQTDFEFLGLIAPPPENGATCGELVESMDSLWRPSWLHWLISALSGTVEIERQTAWLRKHDEDLRQENAKLAELESRLDVVLSKSSFSLF